MPDLRSPETPPSELTRVPPWLRHTIHRRGVWKFCTLEQSCFGPMHDPTPAVPFHHFGVRLDDGPLKMGWTLDGGSISTDLPRDHVSIIPAGASLTGWWNRPVDFACLYFTPDALAAAAGGEAADGACFEIRPAISVRSPSICRLLRTLQADAVRGHPYGSMLGESIFVTMAELLVNDGRIVCERRFRERVGDRRVRRTLEYIHAHLGQVMDISSIAEAAETSPAHLSRSFRSALGCSIWRYVSSKRVELANGLMKDKELTLAQVASMAGFESYSTFAATFKADRGVSPASFRAAL